MLGAGEYSVIRTVISDDPFETMYDTLLYVSISRFVWHSGGKISAKDLSKSVEVCSARMVAWTCCSAYVPSIPRLARRQ